MFKAVIAPIQAWLLRNGQCVGCGSSLQKGRVRQQTPTSSQIECKCGRIFIYDVKAKSYRRALFSEIV